MFKNMTLITKLIGGYVCVALIIVVVAGLGHFNMKSINSAMTTMYNDRLLPVEQLGDADSALYRLRGDIYKFILIPEDRTKSELDMNHAIANTNKQISLYRATSLVQEQKDWLAKFDAAWANYQKELVDILTQVKANNEKAAVQTLREGGAASNARKALAESMDKLTEINVKLAEEDKKYGDKTSSSASTIMLASGGIGLLLAVLLGVFIARSITKPLSEAVAINKRLAEGDLSVVVDVSRGDEIGQLLGAMKNMVDKLKQIMSDINMLSDAAVQ